MTDGWMDGRVDSLPVPLFFLSLLYLDGGVEERRSPGGEGAALAGGRRSIDVGAAERKHYLCHRSRRVYGGSVVGWVWGGESRGEGRVVGGVPAS